MLRKMLVLVMMLVGVSPTFAGTSDRFQSQTTYIIPGLDGKVTIDWDELGVPNIYATTAHDLVMAQGFVHASDRWWQMEWFRHVGLGRLSELGGSTLISYDVQMRTLGLRQNAQNDLDQMPPEVLTLLEAYSAGVNAWLEGKMPGEAAAEYTLLNQLRLASGVEPISTLEPWTPLHSMLWLHVLAGALGTNPAEELLRYQLGPEAASLFFPGYNYAEQPVITDPGRNSSVSSITSRFQPMALGWPEITGINLRFVNPGLGSNNWVVSGSRTVTGKPLLANDPHLGIMMPSIWYEIGLHCEEINAACPYNISGFGFPGTPLIAVGHNDRIAWGATNVGTDTQDLYLLEINPEQPNQYRYNGAWMDMEERIETIQPWDADPVELRVQITRFGPVVTDLFGSPDPIALHWAAADGNRNFEGFMRMNQAANWEEFQAGAASIDLLGQNFMYADVDGNIGYVMTGRVPLRVEGHDGSVPVDGTTDQFEWQGYLDPANNPRLFNPEEGYIFSANNAVIAPENFPQTITVDWEAGYRASRIETLLQSYPVHTPDSFAAMQLDDWNPAAAMVIPQLAASDLSDARLRQAADWLAEWDYHSTVDSPQAALFASFWHEFLIRVFDETGYYWEQSNLNTLEIMWENPDHPAWYNAALDTSDPNVLLTDALQAGLDWMEQTYGTDWVAWRWGDLHIARFQNAPLGQIPDGLNERLDALLPLIRTMFNRDTSVAGCPTCVNATSWGLASGNYDVTSLPSMRLILDLNDWENSRQIHTTGQSGNPSSPHYDDMIPLWSTGTYQPHRFSRDAVEAATLNRWELEPGG